MFAHKVVHFVVIGVADIKCKCSESGDQNVITITNNYLHEEDGLYSYTVTRTDTVTYVSFYNTVKLRLFVRNGTNSTIFKRR